MFTQLAYLEAKELIHKTEVIVVDVRDEESFAVDHIAGAMYLAVNKLRDFCETIQHDTPILVYCYHGISSQAVAQYLVDQGFSRVYSLIGGFESWKRSQLSTSDTNS